MNIEKEIFKAKLHPKVELTLIVTRPPPPVSHLTPFRGEGGADTCLKTGICTHFRPHSFGKTAGMTSPPVLPPLCSGNTRLPEHSGSQSVAQRNSRMRCREPGSEAGALHFLVPSLRMAGGAAERWAIARPLLRTALDSRTGKCPNIKSQQLQYL